jgi:hypothetical protein
MMWERQRGFAESGGRRLARVLDGVSFRPTFPGGNLRAMLSVVLAESRTHRDELALLCLPRNDIDISGRGNIVTGRQIRRSSRKRHPVWSWICFQV